MMQVPGENGTPSDSEVSPDEARNAEDGRDQIAL